MIKNFKLSEHTKFNRLPFAIEKYSGYCPSEMHTHDCVDITFNIKGTMLASVGDMTLDFYEGCIMAVSGNVPHGFAQTKDCEGYSIMFDPFIVESRNPKIKESPGYHSMITLSSLPVDNSPFYSSAELREPYFSQLKELAERLMYEYEQADEYSPSVITGLLYSFVVTFVRQFEQSNAAKALDRNILHLSSEIMQRNVANKISIKEIAAACNISEQHLHRIYRKVRNKTPLQILTDLRMQKAQYLLVTTSLSLSKIADKCGFYDSSHMNKVFRKNCGMLPAQYRKENLQE
ncbi:MAG: helix-turn-helix domain-containing protein [Clostridia bacterium]|nr:helix-turn-helix domain-containing protein [Clostridia bacterium]MBR2973315.1 helix-turn-helix domain-containing protein [Clostridia bacterium]